MPEHAALGDRDLQWRQQGDVGQVVDDRSLEAIEQDGKFTR